MAVFRVERNTGYTVMSNHHLRNKELSLKAKGLLSQMLSLPEDWDYTLAGLSYINRESIDAIRTAVWELEKAGYITRRQGRDEKGKMTAIEYTIYEQPQPPELDCPVLENPTADNPTTENPTSENPMQLNKDISRTNLQKKEKSNTDLSSTHSIPIHSLNPLPLCYRVGKLFSDFMGFLIIDFPRLKRLYQMVCEVVSSVKSLRQCKSELNICRFIAAPERGHQHFPVRLVRVLDIVKGFTQRAFNRLNLCNRHISACTFLMSSMSSW